MTGCFTIISLTWVCKTEDTALNFQLFKNINPILAESHRSNVGRFTVISLAMVIEKVWPHK
jgi:hypothetical protein